jgi:hypothetical protein
VALSLPKIVAARLASGRRATAPLFGTFTVAIALLVVLPETAYLSAAASFETLLRGLPVETSTVQVQATSLDTDAAVTSFEHDVDQRAANSEHGFLRDAGIRVESGEFIVNSRDGTPLPTSGEHVEVLTFANHSDLESHADLMAGAWSAQPPSGYLSVTLVDSGAARLGVQAGDRLCVSNGPHANAICLFVAGVWTQRDPKSAYWVGDYILPLEAEMSRTDLMSPPAQSPSGYHQATVVMVPDEVRIDTSDPATVRASLPLLGPKLTGNLENRQVSTELDSAVLDFDNRTEVAGFALQLITAQLWLVGLYGLLFLAGLKLEQDREAVAVWRTRGWPRRLVAGLLATELVAIAALALIPGAALGFLLALGLTAAVYPPTSLAIRPSLAAVAPTVVAGLAILALALVGLAVVAARTAVVRGRTEMSRPRSKWWNGRWLAVAAAGFSIPILAQARALGDARVRDVGGALPYDLLLPGVGIALIAFAGIALIPLAARAFGRIDRRLEAGLAAMQLVRASGGQQRLSVLVVAAVALALLAAAYSGTAAQNTADRAAYAVGADLRVSARDQMPTDIECLKVDGAVTETQVFRSYAGVGAQAAQVEALGVDPYSFAGTAWSRPGLLSPDLKSMMGSLVAGERGGTVLPATATGLTIWIHGEMTGGGLTASFTDADMQPVSADFGILDFSGWRQLKATFSPAHFRAPLRLRHLAITTVTNEGTVAVSDLEATSSGASTSIYQFDGSETAQVLEPWWVSDGSTGSKLESFHADDRFFRDGSLTSHVFLSPAWSLPVTLNPPVFEVSQSGSFGRLVSQRVPVLMSADLLAANGAAVGDSISMELDNTPVNTVVVGAFNFFPTLYGDGVVFSLPLLLQVLGGEGYARPWPSELWVSGPAARLQADETALISDPAVFSVVSRLDLQRLAAADPIGPAGRANLMLGFVVTCLLAVAAFAIYYAFAARARASEYAILQANGLSPGQVARSLLIEEALVIAFASIMGCVIGAVLAIVILPGLQVSTSLADTVPPTVLAIDPWLAVGGIALTVSGCMLAGRLVARSTGAVDVMRELRSLG